jgi:DNA-3-methyladenine glycosylase I
MLDEGIIRNRSKIESAINNAKLFMEVQKEFGSFDKYVWGFVNGKPIVGGWKEMSQIPAKSKEAETLSKDLKRRGFKFVGPTIMYAYMQAVGLVNDHQVTCFCYKH